MKNIAFSLIFVYWIPQAMIKSYSIEKGMCIPLFKPFLHGEMANEVIIPCIHVLVDQTMAWNQTDAKGVIIPTEVITRDLFHNKDDLSKYKNFHSNDKTVMRQILFTALLRNSG